MHPHGLRIPRLHSAINGQTLQVHLQLQPRRYMLLSLIHLCHTIIFINHENMGSMSLTTATEKVDGGFPGPASPRMGFRRGPPDTAPGPRARASESVQLRFKQESHEPLPEQKPFCRDAASRNGACLQCGLHALLPGPAAGRASYQRFHSRQGLSLDAFQKAYTILSYLDYSSERAGKFSVREVIPLALRKAAADQECPLQMT